jgi:hypothetical protein
MVRFGSAATKDSMPARGRYPAVPTHGHLALTLMASDCSISRAARVPDRKAPSM